MICGHKWDLGLRVSLHAFVTTPLRLASEPVATVLEDEAGSGSSVGGSSAGGASATSSSRVRSLLSRMWSLGN